MGSAKTVLTSGVKLVQGDLLAFSISNATVVWLASLCFSEAFMHQVCIHIRECIYRYIHIGVYIYVYIYICMFI